MRGSVARTARADVVVASDGSWYALDAVAARIGRRARRTTSIFSVGDSISTMQIR
jgi:hypothetical protein